LKAEPEAETARAVDRRRRHRHRREKFGFSSAAAKPAAADNFQRGAAKIFQQINFKKS
jgi:hypothetical protein